MSGQVNLGSAADPSRPASGANGAGQTPPRGPSTLLLLVAIPCLALAGCDLMPEEDAFSWAGLEVMLRQELRNVLAAAVVGSLLGSVAGWLGALVVWQGYRGLSRCWGSDRRDPWDSRLLGALLLLAGAVLGGWLGLLEGGKRGVRTALYQGPIGQELLPQVGNAGADLLVQVDQFLQKPGRPGGDPEGALAEFRAGARKLDARRLQEKAAKLEAASARDIANFVLRKVLEENPEFEGGLRGALLRWFLPRIVEALVEENRPRVREAIDPQPFLELLAAQQEPGGEGLTRPELSRFLVAEVFLPDLFVNLARNVVRTQRRLLWCLAGVAGGALLLGLAVRPFRKARGVSQ